MESKNSKKKFAVVEKFQSFLSRFFYKLFDNSHLLYTIIFFISALIIAMLSLIHITGIGDVVLYLATSTSLAFIILTLLGLIPQLQKYLFSEKILGKRKLIIFGIILILSFVILSFYFLFGSYKQIPIEFLGWNVLLPPIFIIAYFGWNLLQIIFLRPSIESAAMKVNNKLIPEGQGKQKTLLSYIFLGIAIVAPILMILGTLIGFYSYFANSKDILYWFIGSHLIMFCVIAITSWKLIDLFIKSKKNDSINVFSSVFYLIVWVYLWYRFFSFVNSFRQQKPLGVDLFTSIINILLMVMTAITVLRSLGSKVYGFRLFNENNMPFFLYAFTMLYIEGQIIMIIGAGRFSGVFTGRNQINLINNVLILVITVVFYLWYSGYTLQRKGLILRTNFTPKEVIKILKDYQEYLESKGQINVQDLDSKDFQEFLDEKKITISGVEDIELEEEFKRKKPEVPQKPKDSGEIEEKEEEIIEKPKEESLKKEEVTEKPKEESLKKEEVTEKPKEESLKKEERKNPYHK